MNYVILHESAHRIRIHVGTSRMSLEHADLLDYYLKAQPCVADCKVFERTGDASIKLQRTTGSRERLLAAMDAFSYADEETKALVPEDTGRALNRHFETKLTTKVLMRLMRKLFLPRPLRTIRCMIKSLRFIGAGLGCLRRGKLEVPVLDATAITASMLRGDFATASFVMFLLEVGEILEEWTHRKSVGDLARSMALQVDKVWVRGEHEDILMDVRHVQKGDLIVVRTSNVIPLDGIVVSGEASINQASMTGESVPVHRSEGGYVYAGTVVEEGELVVEVSKTTGSGKYDQIVRMIEESEKLKSNTEARAFHLADRLVPYSLLGAAITLLLTRNVMRAMSFLMVDFSCALKLSMPLAVLSAIREASGYGISVKGGKFLEAVAAADTIVLDKTGTLTHARPTVAKVVTFGDIDETEALRIAACLEEHYPHSIANAVVAEANKRGIEHDEMHSAVKYVVAHGIASEIDGRKAIIGSYHFVFEDEACKVPAGEEHKLDELPPEYSHLYLAIGGELVAVICIFDPLRKEATQVIDALHELGIKRVVMMTGDNERTAAAIARAMNIDEYHSEVLPEEKAAFVKAEHDAGRKVIMVGDGVNDTPALSEADAGIAISDGAAIAREVADITINADSLFPLVYLRRIATALMRRIDGNYRFIIGFNAMLIALGVANVLPPASGALLHNGSTILAGLKSMTPLLEKENPRRS